MNEAQFQRELSKYKVVRLEDYYRPRFKKVETKTGASKHAHAAERKVGGEKIKLDSKDQSFWVLMEGALADVLAPAETAAVIAKMKKNMDDVPGSISLEDLDAAAGTLLA